MQAVRGDMCHGWITLITTIYLLEEVNDLTCIYIYTYKYNMKPLIRFSDVSYSKPAGMNTCLATFTYNKWATCLKRGIWTSKFQPGNRSKCQPRVRVLELGQGNQQFPEQVPRKSGVFPWYSPPQQVRYCIYLDMYRWEQCAWFSHDSCITLLLLDVFEAVCEIWVVCPSQFTK